MSSIPQTPPPGALPAGRRPAAPADRGRPAVGPGAALETLPLAVVWAKRHEVARHRPMMTGLFYGGLAINMFIAFIPGRTMWRLFFG
jgi:hypothetical protein